MDFRVACSAFLLIGIASDQAVARTKLPEGRFVDLAIGSSPGDCGIQTNGALVCEDESQNDPGPYKALAGGMGHLCALREDGRIRCWGTGKMSSIASPQRTFVSIAAGPLGVCGITVEVGVVCWDARRHPVQRPPAGLWKELAVGQSAVCGLREDGNVACWGSHSDGLRFEGPVRSFAVGVFAACAIGNDGELTCKNADFPTPAGKFRSVRAAGWDWCALTESGDAICWSENDPTNFVSRAEGPFTAVFLGSIDACGLDADGIASCWDTTPSGQTTDGRPARTGGIVSRDQAASAKKKALVLSFLSILLVTVVVVILVFKLKSRKRPGNNPDAGT